MIFERIFSCSRLKKFTCPPASKDALFEKNGGIFFGSRYNEDITSPAYIDPFFERT